MRNKLLLIFSTIFFNTFLLAENLLIQSKNITLDKNDNTSIFENEVTIITEDNNTIKSDFAKYNKQTKFIILKNNIIAVDNKNNTIETDYAEYDELSKTFKSIGPTRITTSEKYIIEGKNIILNNVTQTINSDENTIITDRDQNKIYLENFEYQTKNNIFKSIGFTKVLDIKSNTYEFSQVYIDTKKKELLGTDIKAFMNDENFKINENNKPRIFANSLKINNETNSFEKSVFTLCNYRKNDKCPPWTIQASKMLHDNKKKTIYYDNALIKVYNIPVFYFPKISHPDHTVDRRSGFLPPSFSGSKNLGSGLSIPYFWALNDDKNLTFTNNFYIGENPLFLSEYHQAFKDANLMTDIGYTEGYKKITATKKSGNKSHFFSKFIKNYSGKNNSENSLAVSFQNVSDDKYLKLHKIKSNLVDYNETILKNSIDYTHENENIFFGFNSSVYETLNEDYNDKYEYILPEITLDKNLISSEKIGNISLLSNYKAHKYDTNKFANFLINDFEWSSNQKNFNTGITGKFLGNFKNINYETKNIDLYKKDTTSEFYGALGYLSEINLKKKVLASIHSLKPKILVRYAPGSMRKENSGSRLNPDSAFTMDRLNNFNSFETGLSGTLGFDYNIKSNKKEFDFSLAQVINEKENKKMASNTSLDEKLSDVVGVGNYKINDSFKVNYNFSIDQNYEQINYNEFGTTFNTDLIKVDFNYLKETKHMGDQEYFKTKFDIAKSNNNVFSFETKRNLVKNSSEFYNLSYEYINDCLRAGLVYRREFYADSELEPENSLMFKITLTPFGDINSPSFSK
jgi:LPS-assembly protein